MIRIYRLVAKGFSFGQDFIEAWGRGIPKIKDCRIPAGNDIPEFIRQEYLR